MAINFYNISKWARMLMGNSIQHVEQGLGKCFAVDKIEGYYNDLTKKVSEKQKLDKAGVPLFHSPSGKDIYFPIMIFQYGLGAYDLYLLEKDASMLQKVIICAEWAINNQSDDGSWKSFEEEFPEHPYSSMAQGEAASLFLRVYKSTGDEKFLLAARKAIEFMLLDIEKGGTTEYDNENVFLHEFTHKSVVLNGWIFSLFGLYDYNLVVKNDVSKKIYINSVNTLKKFIVEYDNGYWSMYDLSGMITSPFYHKLHIAQMKAMYVLTNENIFLETARKWEKYYMSPVKKSRAFIKKAIQKIVE